MNRYYYESHAVNERTEYIVREVYGNITVISSLEESSFSEGDVIIMDSVYDFVSPSLPVPAADNKYNEDCISLIVEQYRKFYNKGIVLVFEKSPQCNSSFISELISSAKIDSETYFEPFLKLAVANFDENRIMLLPYRRRHVVTAEINGNKLGIKKGTRLATKKSHSAKDLILKLSKDFNGSLSDPEAIKEIGISRNTFYKYKKELKEESGKQE